MIPSSPSPTSHIHRSQRAIRLGFAIATAFLLTAPALPAATYAVVVGVDDYPGSAKLNSCVNDARAIAAFLLRSGIPAAQVGLLLDKEASATAIENALRQQSRRAARGDEVFFYFSGHGTIMPDWDGTGAITKAMVAHGALPAPVGAERLLTQGRLKAILAETRADRVVVVLDCCHAGTWSRSVGGSATERIKAVDIGWTAAEGHLAKAAPDAFAEFQRKAAPVDYTWLGACQSNQVSYCGQPLSKFTGHLLEQLNKTPAARVADFFPSLSQTVAKATAQTMRGSQLPQVEGNSKLPLLAALRQPTPPAVTNNISPPPPPPPRTNRFERRDFPLTLQLSQPRYVEGDKLTVTVKPERDCYLRLYLINAAAKVQQIFPNQFQQENFLRRSEAAQVPAATGNKFDFVMEGPFGVETIVAVGSTKQFTDLQKPRYQDGFFDLGEETPGGIFTRGIRVQGPASAGPKAEISFTKAEYTVSKKE